MQRALAERLQQIFAANVCCKHIVKSGEATYIGVSTIFHIAFPKKKVHDDLVSWISERIQSIAPAGAQFYRLTVHFHDGTSRIHPAEPGAFFRLGESPNGLQAGTYSVNFFDSSFAPIVPYDCQIEVSAQGQVQRTQPQQLSLGFSGNTGSSVVYAQAPTVAQGNAQPPPQGQAVQSATPVAPASRIPGSPDEFDLEFRRHLHAMDMQEREQEFIKNAGFVQEIGETFALNRILRRELMELQRIIVLSSQQAYKDAENIKGTIHGLLALQKDVLALAAEKITQPAPPPPDYVGLGHSALAMVKEIGVALINRSQRLESGGSIPAKPAVAQLPAPLVESADPAKVQPPDIVEKIAHKLKGMSEVDLAVLMSSPDSWKALIDELRSQNHKLENAQKDSSHEQPSVPEARK